MRRNIPRARAATQKPSAPKPKGRYGKVWLSPEFVAWCKKRHLKPEGFGACVLHDFALTNPDLKVMIRSDDGPVDVKRIYDLPEDEKEGK